MNSLDDVNSPDANHAPDSVAGGVNYSRAGFGALGDVHIEHKPTTNVNIASSEALPKQTPPVSFRVSTDEGVDYSKAGMGAGGSVHIEHKPETTTHQTTINHNGAPHTAAHGVMSWQVTLIAVCGILVAGFLFMQGRQPTVIHLPPLPPNSRPIDVKEIHYRSDATKAEIVGQPVAPSPLTIEQVESPSNELAMTYDDLNSATKENPYTNSLGMKFVPLPGPKVSSRLVLIGSHEVRQKDFAAYLKSETPETLGPPTQVAVADPKVSPADLQLHPVVNVNLRDARKFCEWLSQQNGVTYRLTTDHEWSLALGGVARAEDASRTASEKNNQITGAFVWGTGSARVPRGAGNFADHRTKLARADGFVEKPMQQGIFDYYDDGFAWTAPTMRFEPNEAGLYDMAGNAWEWCIDQAAPDADKQPLRGGSWLSAYPSELGASTRLMIDRDKREPSFGFRCVIVVD